MGKFSGAPCYFDMVSNGMDLGDFRCCHRMVLEHLLGDCRLDLEYFLVDRCLDLEYFLGDRCLDMEYFLGNCCLGLEYFLGNCCMGLEYFLGDCRLDLDNILGSCDLDNNRYLRRYLLACLLDNCRPYCLGSNNHLVAHYHLSYMGLGCDCLHNHSYN